MSVPDISVIIPHYNDLERLDRCLAALSVQTLSPERFEIIVSDNASPAGEAAVAQVIAGRARLVIATEKGAGPARNMGVKAARGAILAFTDADCLPDPGWLEAGIALLDRYDIVGGRMVVLVGEGRAMTGAEAFECVFAFDNKSYVLKKGFSVTANLFCTRATFDAVGDFRLHVSEDIEWCFRARAGGHSIGYADDAVVGHPARANWLELKHKWQRVNAELFKLKLTEPNGRLRWGLATAIIPVSIGAHIFPIFRNQQVKAGRARMAAVVTLIRIRAWRFKDSTRLLFSQVR